MNLVKKISFLFFLTLFLSGSLKAAELIMVEQQGCYYCLEWKDQLGHIYPNIRTLDSNFQIRPQNKVAYQTPVQNGQNRVDLGPNAKTKWVLKAVDFQR